MERLVVVGGWGCGEEGGSGGGDICCARMSLWRRIYLDWENELVKKRVFWVENEVAEKRMFWMRG